MDIHGVLIFMHSPAPLLAQPLRKAPSQPFGLIVLSNGTTATTRLQSQQTNWERLSDGRSSSSLALTRAPTAKGTNIISATDSLLTDPQNAVFDVCRLISRSSIRPNLKISRALFAVAVGRQGVY